MQRSRRFAGDTNFAITVRNHSGHALRSVVSFSLPADVELSADVAHVSCRTTASTVVCQHHVTGYWEIVPANGSVTYNVFLDHWNGSGPVDWMPMPRVDIDSDQ